MKHSYKIDNIAELDVLYCIKRGKLIMNTDTDNNNTNNLYAQIRDNNSNNKRILCYDILSKWNNFVSVSSSFGPPPPPNSNNKEADSYYIIISSVLTQLIAKGDEMKSTHKYFRSSSGNLPPFSIERYVSRLITHAPCDKGCFLAALLYMDRLSEYADFVFNSKNIHRAYLVSLLLAAKFFHDQPYNNGAFASVGGVSLQELNTMELNFLAMVDYRVSVTQWEFNMYANLVDKYVQNIGRPSVYYVSPESSLVPIKPDTMNTMIRHVTPAIPIPTST